MAQKKTDTSYSDLTAALKAASPACLYIFHGEEHYLLEHSLSQLRRVICPDGLGSFNYRRFDGASLSPDELEAAIDTFPVFAERTLVEVHDFDIFKGAEEQRIKIANMLETLPDYVCLVFIYGTIPYKPDKRQKTTAQILKQAKAVEFSQPEQSKLIKWIRQHFSDAGKNIAPNDADYLAFITGGAMSALSGEIEKVSAYAAGDTVTRADIDAVVEPVLDAVAYKLTDAVTDGRHADAVRILGELFDMREAPHKLLYGITLKMRQLLAARICFENGMSADRLMEMCDIRYPFQAKSLMSAARKTTLSRCRNAVLFCTDTALELNSAPEPESRLIELIAKLALAGKDAG